MKYDIKQIYNEISENSKKQTSIRTDPKKLLSQIKITYVNDKTRICINFINSKDEYKFFLRFLVRKGGFSGMLQDRLFILRGIISKELIKDITLQYISTFLFCKICKKRDVVLIKFRSKIANLRCNACGLSATYSIDKL